MSEVLYKNEVSWLRFMARLWIEDASRDPLTVDELSRMFTQKFGKEVPDAMLVSAVQGDTHADCDRPPVHEWPVKHSGNRLMSNEEVAWLRRYCYRLVVLEDKKPLPMRQFAMAFYLRKFAKQGQPERPNGADFVSGQSIKAAVLGETYRDAGALWMCLESWPHKARPSARKRA